MKKIISISLIIAIIINIFPPNFVWAYDDTDKSTTGDATVDYDTFMEDSEQGASSVGSSTSKKPYKTTDSGQNVAIKIVVQLFNIIPTTVRMVMIVLTDNDYDDEINKVYGESFSIQKVVFNKLALLDINFFKTEQSPDDIQGIIKSNVSKFYDVIKNLAIAFMLALLVYTGIRMALSTLATEKARYKQMLINWASGFILLMILPYIMIIILEIAQILIDFCETIMISVCGNDVFELEESLMNVATTSTGKGFSIIIPTIIYWMLVFYQVKFLFMYGKRLFNTAFLVIISPLILIQYIFDKIGDGKASSFKRWMTEFSLNVLIQPLHALLYMIFMVIALNIMEEAPILAVVFISALSRGERVLRNILRVKDSATVQSMQKNMSAKKTASKLGGK